MLTQNEPESRIRGQLDDFLSGMNATSGGASGTHQKEPTPPPAGLRSGARARTTPAPLREGGGSSAPDEKDPTAMPAGLRSGSRPVTTATPVGKWPSTVRNREPSTGSALMRRLVRAAPP